MNWLEFSWVYNTFQADFRCKTIQKILSSVLLGCVFVPVGLANPTVGWEGVASSTVSSPLVLGPVAPRFPSEMIPHFLDDFDWVDLEVCICLRRNCRVGSRGESRGLRISMREIWSTKKTPTTTMLVDASQRRSRRWFKTGETRALLSAHH